MYVVLCTHILAAGAAAKHLKKFIMAKEIFSISVSTATSGDGMIYNTKFTDQPSAVAEGDKFLIPPFDLMVMFGTEVGAGTANRRAVAERTFVVRLDNDNNPTEVSQLFVSQMCKKDAKTNKHVFKNELTEAHRLGMSYFKKFLADKVLTVGKEKQCNVRIWDEKANAWKRDGEDFAIDENGKAREFKASEIVLTEDQLATALKLLRELYETIPAITISEE